MTYWQHTDEHPGRMPINEREAWHRDAWDREQVELRRISNGQAGNDVPRKTRDFGYARPGVVHEF